MLKATLEQVGRAMRQGRVIWLAFVLGGLTATGALSCARERGTNTAEKEVVLYLGAITSDPHAPPGYSSRLYSFCWDELTLSLSDSMTFPAYPADIAVSQDGKALFLLLAAIGAPDSSVVTRVDAISGETIWSRRVSWWVKRINLIDSDSKLICSEAMFDTDTGRNSEASNDTIAYLAGQAAGTLILAARKSLFELKSDSLLLIVDLLGKRPSATIPCRLLDGTSLYVYSAALHPNGKHVVSIGARSGVGAWTIVSRTSDGQTVLQWPLVYPYGEIALTASGKFAAVTDPSLPLIGNSHQTLDVFDLDTFAHVFRISSMAASDFRAGQLAFVPDDDTKVVVAPLADQSGFGPVSIVDIGTMSIVKELCYPECFSGRVFGGMALGLSEECGRGGKDDTRQM